MIICTIVLPSLYIHIIRQPHDVVLTKKKFRSRWYALFEHLDSENHNNLWFNVLFCARRMIYVEIAFSLNMHPCQQIQILLLMNIMFSIFVGNNRPMKHKVIN